MSLLILFSLTETITSSFPFRGYLAGCGTLVADQVRGEKNGLIQHGRASGEGADVRGAVRWEIERARAFSRQRRRSHTEFHRRTSPARHSARSA